MNGIAALVLAGAVALGPALAAAQDIARPSFNDDGSVNRPEGWRQWVYVGTPLTPNALNGGEAPFPEFHNVYVEPSAWDHYVATGEWAEGTQIVKELVLTVTEGAGEGGATCQVSGCGYFMAEFAGLELELKDSARFPDMPGGWAFFSFGHRPEPYAETAEAFPAEACNACHEENAATDWVFTQFYPVVRAAR